MVEETETEGELEVEADSFIREEIGLRERERQL